MHFDLVSSRVARVAFACMGVSVFFSAGCAEAPDPIERGEHLVEILACGDCHTPMKMGAQGPEPDLSRFLSGAPAGMELPPPPPPTGPWIWHGIANNTAFAGPWGITYAINLTPDDTGLGVWTEEMFVKAMRTGKHMGVESGRPILPPMPWPAYANMTDEEVHAVWAYLQTVPPISNQAPAAKLAPAPGGAQPGTGGEPGAPADSEGAPAGEPAQSEAGGH